MSEIQVKIAAGLERAFASRGFAEPSVEDLRDAAGVSLRTLYKYAPSRNAMVRMALEHRHQRYMSQVFDDANQSLDDVLDKVAGWMRTEASHGCLFHAAVAAAPDDSELRDLLSRHKSEVSQRATDHADQGVTGSDLLLIIEGLTQTWPLIGEAAVTTAKRLAHSLKAAAT